MRSFALIILAAAAQAAEPTGPNYIDYGDSLVAYGRVPSIGDAAVNLGTGYSHVAEAPVAAGVGAPVNYVTEEEYAQREAERPKPPLPVPVAPTWAVVVKTETELHAAMALSPPAEVVIPNVTIALTRPIIPLQSSIWLHGLGSRSALIPAANAPASMDRVIHPKAADFRLSDLVIDGGRQKLNAIWMDGLSRGADRMRVERTLFASVGYAVQLTGGPGTIVESILEDFTFCDNRVTDCLHGGLQMSWEILRPRIERNVVLGNGALTDWNALWIGLGVCDAHITGNTFGRVGRMGIEVFYPHANPAVPGQPGPSLVSKLYPFGPSVTASDNIIFDTGSFGESWAGCKRSAISGETIRNATGIGAEFVDELPGESNYTASDFRVINTKGTGVSIDRIRGGRFTNLFIDGVTAVPGAHRGIISYMTDDVTLDGCRIMGGGPHYIIAINSTRQNVLNCQLMARAGESFTNEPEGGNFGFYSFNSDVFFARNIIRGNATNPLRTVLNSGSVTTSAMRDPITAPGGTKLFDDPDNFRGRRFVSQ